MSKSKEEIRAHSLWSGINSRVGKHKNYLSSQNLFESRDIFTNWCFSQEKFMEKDENGRHWGLDKDIIVPFNRHYSVETCCFVPNEVNVLFSNSQSGKLLKGVFNLPGVHKHKYMAGIKIKNKLIKFGPFENELEAHRVWQEALIEKIRNVVKENEFGLDERILSGMMKHASVIELSYNLGIVTENTLGSR